MVEIDLENFEEFYEKELNTQFFKIRKLGKKIITEMRDTLIRIKICMDHFKEAEDRIDKNSLRSLHLFSDRIRKEVDAIEIPEEEDISFDNLNKLKNSIKKLFTTINQIAKKSLPKIRKEVQPQIKELHYETRKLGKKQTLLDNFLRKKYLPVKNAEYLLKRLDKFFILKDNIENAKKDLDKFEEEVEERLENLNNLNSQLIELEKNELFKTLEKETDNQFKLKLNIKDLLNFSKALKKFKFEIEKETIHVPNINLSYLRDFLKNPIGTISKEGRDLPKFSSLLVQLRHTLENNKLNLKSDTKVKTIEQINFIFKEKKIQNSIEQLKELSDKIKGIKNSINEIGLAKKLDNIKNEISTNTVKLERAQGDLERKNKDYMRYLGSLRGEREEYQNLIKGILKEPVKINITFSF